MNTSSDQFMHACESINAKKILIFPNNVNSILAARQAVDIMNAKGTVEVMETSSAMEAYFALQMDVPTDSNEERIPAFKENVKLVTTVGVSIASKDYDSDTFSCTKGEFIATVNDKLVAKGDNAIEAFKNALNAMEDLSDKYAMKVFLGKEQEQLLDGVSNLLDMEFSDIEHSIDNGNQDVYLILAGVL